MNIQWTIGIGDPSPAGWVATGAYVMTAALCAVAATKSRQQADNLSREQLFWVGTAGLLVLLGSNKQLDLQSLLTQVVRLLAKTEGWYGGRRRYQTVFVVAVGLCSAAGITGVFWKFRRNLGPVRTGLFGLGLIVAFVVVRAAAFNHVSVSLGADSFGARWSWLLELVGIGIIACGSAWKCLRTDGRRGHDR